MNIPVIAMAMAAGISIDAALAHGLTGLRRRPRDAVRITFALQALAVAAGALAVVVMYTTDSPRTHFEVMKWAYFPAGLAWWMATMWLVAFYTGVRPMRWLLALSAGGGALIVLNLILPYGMLHREIGSIVSLAMAASQVSVMAAPSPHPAYYLVSALELAAVVFMFYAAWRVHRRGERRKAWLITAVLTVFLVVGVLDALQDYGVLADLYYTQVSFVVLVFASQHRAARGVAPRGGGTAGQPRPPRSPRRAARQGPGRCQHTTRTGVSGASCHGRSRCAAASRSSMLCNASRGHSPTAPISPRRWTRPRSRSRSS